MCAHAVYVIYVERSYIHRGEALMRTFTGCRSSLLSGLLTWFQLDSRLGLAGQGAAVCWGGLFPFFPFCCAADSLLRPPRSGSGCVATWPPLRLAELYYSTWFVHPELPLTPGCSSLRGGRCPCQALTLKELTCFSALEPKPSQPGWGTSPWLLFKHACYFSLDVLVHVTPNSIWFSLLVPVGYFPVLTTLQSAPCWINALFTF